MKKRALTIILLFLVTISFGCSTSEPQRKDNINVHKGTQGLILRFLPQTPPSIAYSGETMDIQIEVSNKGAYETEGKLYLTGFDKSIIEVDREYVAIPTIEGKAEYIQEGGKDIIVLSDQDNLGGEINVALPIGVDKYNTRIE